MTTVKGYMGSVSFDGKTIRVEKSMRSEQAIPVDQVTSVGILKAGLGMRAIRFSVAGGSSAAPAIALGSHGDFARDPYALTFRKKRLGEFQSLIAEIEAARSSH